MRTADSSETTLGSNWTSRTAAAELGENLPRGRRDRRDSASTTENGHEASSYVTPVPDRCQPRLGNVNYSW